MRPGGAPCHRGKAGVGAPCRPLLCWARSSVLAFLLTLLGCFWEHCHQSVPWTHTEPHLAPRDIAHRGHCHRAQRAVCPAAAPAGAHPLSSLPDSALRQQAICPHLGGPCLLPQPDTEHTELRPPEWTPDPPTLGLQPTCLRAVFLPLCLPAGWTDRQAPWCPPGQCCAPSPH